MSRRKIPNHLESKATHLLHLVPDLQELVEGEKQATVDGMSPVLVGAGGPWSVTLLSGAGGRQTLALLSTNQIRTALRGGRGGGHGPSCCGAGGEQEAGARQPVAGGLAPGSLAPWRLAAGGWGSGVG